MEGLVPVPDRPQQKKRRAQNQGVEDEVQLPKKRFYRQRAHANPFSDHDLR